MKKVMSLLLIALMCCGILAGCGGSEKPVEKKGENVVEKEFQGITFNIPETWGGEEATETELFFYQDNAMFLVQFIEQTSINMQDELSVQQFIDGFGQGFVNFELIERSEENVAGAKALRFTSTFVQQEVTFDSTVVVMKHNGGLISFMIASDSKEDKKYNKDFEKIIDSVNNISGATSEGNAEEGVNPDEVLNQVKVNAIPTQDETMCVFITNESETIIDELQVQINYKDENGTTIDVQDDWHDMVLPGSTVVSRIDTPQSFADFEIVSQIELETHPSYENHVNQVEITSNKGEKGIIVEITNNAEVMIDEIELIAVLYNGEEITEVTYPDDIMDVQPGQKVTEKIDTFGAKYDRFEIYVNQAHTFGL